MEFNWKLFVAALGLAFILEGCVYFLAADKLPAVLRLLSERPPSDLRKLGLTAIILGLLLVYFIKA
jgi:uncharacterized protein